MPNPARLKAISMLMQTAGSQGANQMRKRSQPGPVQAAGPDAADNDFLGEQGAPPDDSGYSAKQTLEDAVSTGDSTAKRVKSMFGDEEPQGGAPNGMHGEGAETMTVDSGSDETVQDPMEGAAANNEPDDMYGAWDADDVPFPMQPGGGDAGWDDNALGMGLSKSPTPQTPGGEDPNEVGDDVEPEFDQMPGVKLPRRRR